MTRFSTFHKPTRNQYKGSNRDPRKLNRDTHTGLGCPRYENNKGKIVFPKVQLTENSGRLEGKEARAPKHCSWSAMRSGQQLPAAVQGQHKEGKPRWGIQWACRKRWEQNMCSECPMAKALLKQGQKERFSTKTKAICENPTEKHRIGWGKVGGISTKSQNPMWIPALTAAIQYDPESHQPRKRNQCDINRKGEVKLSLFEGGVILHIWR